MTLGISVLVGAEVTADFTADPRAGEAPLTVQFTDQSINATNWSWTFISGGTALMTENPLWMYQNPGNYTVTLLAENAYRMDTETKVEYISVYGPITASFTASDYSIENGTAVQFTSTSTGNPYTFAWDFGDGTTSTEQNPSHVYTKTGLYPVTLTATNPLGPDTSETGSIRVYDRVHASFTANNTRGLAPLTVQFTDTSTGNPTSWAWDFGDGTTSTEQNPLHTYSHPGVYPVTLTANHADASHTTTVLHCIVAVFGVVQIPNGTGLPTDTNADSKFDDVNGNGRRDFADLVLYFNQMSWIAANEPISAFDYNDNGRIDFADVVWLFNHIGGPIITSTPTAAGWTTISGTTYQVDEGGALIGGIGGVTTRLTLVSPSSLLPVLMEAPFGFTNRGEKTTMTAADGSYSFTVPDVPATYRLAETGLDPKYWFMVSPVDGVIGGVIPGGTDYNFQNYRVPAYGIVMYLNKTVEEGCDGGHVVNGTTFMGDARAYDYVTLNGRIYQFGNNEQFRFTIRENQTAGQLFVEHEHLSKLTFNVTFEVREFGTTEWMFPEGFSRDNSNPRYPANYGVPTSISISAINKNMLNDNSTLTYRYPVCESSDTLLRLNGEVRIDSPADSTCLEFTDLHAVDDNRYGEGLYTMWIYLMPGYDFLLAQGVCVSP